jgi:tetratricopeptide (TPR) repeat protein
MNQPQTYYSQLYQNFRAIEAGEFRKLVHFYERNEKEILKLEFQEYFELLVTYTNALFEIAAYQRHLLMADVVIEISFMENITEIGGQEIFRSTLFQKAASYYNLVDFPKAIHVLTELIKIEPNDHEVAEFLERCIRKSRPQLIRHTRAIAIFLFLATALIISVEALIVRNFYLDYVSLFELTRNCTLILGVFILVTGALAQRLRAKSEVVKLVNSIKKIKKIDPSV